ncbi:DDT domain-containing protein [Actinidia chinensis var. chinensis]|uniref:DDT domain-containing protein n=2 Tax=Actinidia TaxID=3624 RepID=A0A2R6PAT5_ACTCC|nr:DDT domain-containing protein [Actinidia chinensis var. chinensis]
MPLYKRKPFPLAERPTDLKPQEHVFQVRFTKEIFRDYGEYLNRINLYRQRIWTCKVTAKTNLTFEEALVSEKHATEKVQQFPKELVVPVLRDVQFSMLTLKDLANKIATKLQEHLSEGTELYGKRNNRVYPCKIIKVLAEEAGRTQYEVAWLDKDKKVTENAVLNGEDLVRKKLPFTRDVLKSFIRESTYRSVPWVLHDKLASKYGISTDSPEELRSNFSFQDGHMVRNRKRSRKEEASKEELRKCKSKKMGNGKSKPWIPGGIAEDKLKEEPIIYPIDDLLVQPASDDPVFTERPSPSKNFQIPMDCVGDLLMIWDFCSSFSRLLHLWPFSLEDFEHALCHKDSNLIVIAESHSAILRLLIKDDGNYNTAIQKKKRKPKITLVTWTEYLCDFLEMIDDADLSNYITTVRRGHYGLLDIHAKLGIFRELVAQALTTDLMREKLDECIEQRQELAATRRGEALEEGRKRREAKELWKAESDGKEIKGRSLKSVGSSSKLFGNGNHSSQNGDVADKWNKNKNALSPQGKHAVTNRKKVDTIAKRNGKQHKMDAKAALENVKDSSKKGVQKLMRDDGNKAMDRSNEQRKEYLEREMEKRFIRTNSLGKDRYYNRYWFFKRDGRIFIESSDSEQWAYYSTKEELDTFVASLNRKGERERALKKQLEKYYNKICLEMQKRSKEVAHKIAMEEAVVRRSTRVRAPPRENPALAFLKYVNKWNED